MSTTRDLVTALKSELKAAGMTYAQLASQLGIAESSVKRIFAKADMPLSRIDDVLRVLNMDFAELARSVADAQPPQRALTLAQETALVADRKLLAIATCCASQWTYAQMVATYAISETEAIAQLARLDRLGIIELQPRNRYRLKIAKGFRWRPDGPMMAFFRDQVVGDFYGGRFDGDGETLLLVHGQVGVSQARAFAERLQRVADDFATQHLVDQKLSSPQKRPYTLVVGMRSWLFAALRDLQRPGAERADAGAPLARPG